MSDRRSRRSRQRRFEICHQINLEFLAHGVLERDGVFYPYPIVGTDPQTPDSQTPMVNDYGVVDWGVVGIEAEAAMLGQPDYLLLPDAIDVHLHGRLGIERRDGQDSAPLVLRIDTPVEVAYVSTSGILSYVYVLGQRLAGEASGKLRA